MNKHLVSIVSPVYNEEDVIEEFMTRVQKSIAPMADTHDFEIILVDDGSRDQSLEIMKRMSKAEPRLTVIELSRNYGQTAALQAGIDGAKGDIIITMDSDLQHFPEEIPQFVAKLSEDFDIVYGWRHKRAEGVVRRWPSRIANLIIKKISGIDVHDFGTTYRAYRHQFVKELRLLGEFHRFVPALGGILGARIAELPIENIERPKGSSSYGIGRTFGVALDLLLLFFLSRYMDRPIRIFGKIAAALTAIASAIIGMLVVYAYSTGTHAVAEHQGWFLLSILMLLFAGQLLMTGIIAEILVRIHYAQDDSRVYRIRHEWTGQGGSC